MKGLFAKIEPTLQNMNSIAEFNRVVVNYLKLLRIEKANEILKKNGKV